MQPEILRRLTDLREAARDRAGKSLADARKAEGRARQQLETLARYRTGYAKQRATADQSGVSVALLRNHISFERQLEGAVTTARTRVAVASKDVATKSAQWRAAERSLLAYETLAKRQTASVARTIGRAEQRSADARTTARVARARQQHQAGDPR
ncbi:MAG TPA: flagellar export protein FliJ [Nevskiaceae bacterium]|nr:flagellar export protein FliJ [Nevskiaceae bacterium]